MGMLETQELLQNLVGNAVPMEGTVLSEYVRWNALALIKEVGEALDHVSWKPWTVDSGWLERHEYVGELVDVMLFLMNMLVAVGVDDQEFNRAVALKQEIVRQRLLSDRYEQRRVAQ